MGLESVTQGEVSQKKKNKYHILMSIYGIRKIVQMSLFAGQNRHPGVEKRHADSRGKQRGMDWESKADAYIHHRVKRTAHGKLLMQDRELS